MADTNGDIKVVIHLTGGKWTVGIQAPGCDPVITVLNGQGEDSDMPLERIPELIKQARAKWAESPQNPKGEVPQPPPPPPQATRTPTPQPSRADSTQTNLF